MKTGVTATVRAAPPPKHWLRNPLRGAWVTDPLAMDCAFQMMILWSSMYRGAPSLPCAVGCYRQYVTAFPKTGCRVVLAVTHGDGALVESAIEFMDADGRVLATATGCEYVIDRSLHDAFGLNRLGIE